MLLHSLRALARTGLLGPRPLRAIALLVWCCLRYGASLFTVAAWSALRFPDRDAVVEPGRRVTSGALVARAPQIAGSRGLAPRQTVGLLCRNRVVFVEALLACARAGADVVLINTAFAAEQITALGQAGRLDLLICEDELRPAL